MRFAFLLLCLCLAMPRKAFAEAETAFEAGAGDYCGSRGGYAEEASGTGRSCLEALNDANNRIHPKLETSRNACQQEDGHFQVKGEPHAIAEKEGPPVTPQAACAGLSDGTFTITLRVCARCSFL